jgi:NADH-quinone oxidoreductase subunit E
MPKKKTAGAAASGTVSPVRKKTAPSAGRAAAREVIGKYGGRKRAVIQILQDLQERFRWLAPETLEAVALELDVSLAHVFSVATFYKSFSLEPRGRHICTVCMGTACHVRGGAAVLEHFERKLGVRPGQTTPDGGVTLERVNCLGACALAPLAVVDGRYYGQMTETKANDVLKPILERGPFPSAAPKAARE